MNKEVDGLIPLIKRSLTVKKDTMMNQYLVLYLNQRGLLDELAEIRKIIFESSSYLSYNEYYLNYLNCAVCLGQLYSLHVPTKASFISSGLCLRHVFVQYRTIQWMQIRQSSRPVVQTSFSNALTRKLSDGIHKARIISSRYCTELYLFVDFIKLRIVIKIYDKPEKR